MYNGETPLRWPPLGDNILSFIRRGVALSQGLICTGVHLGLSKVSFIEGLLNYVMQGGAFMRGSTAYIIISWG